MTAAASSKRLPSNIQYICRYHKVNTSITNGNNSIGWIQKYKKEEGRCFSYKVPDYLRSLKVIGVTIHLVKPIDVYLHHPGQFLTWNIYSLTSRIGEQTFVDVAQEVTRNQL